MFSHAGAHVPSGPYSAHIVHVTLTLTLPSYLSVFLLCSSAFLALLAQPLSMVGTPQLPLKYRRKGDTDCRVLSPDLDMSYHSPLSSYSSHFGSEDYMLRSPTFYSSSSSIAPSSPVRSLRTPEPPSSPPYEPYIATTSKTFWDVAFNYGPDFPYKPRSHTKPNTPFGREQFLTRRRSSCSSAPALVSDVDLSEFSEDNDTFHMDDISTVEVDTTSVTDLQGMEECTITMSNRLAENKALEANGEIDVAAVLLDLSRQARRSDTSKSIEVSARNRPDNDYRKHSDASAREVKSGIVSESIAEYTPVPSDIASCKFEDQNYVTSEIFSQQVQVRLSFIHKAS